MRPFPASTRGFILPVLYSRSVSFCRGWFEGQCGRNLQLTFILLGCLNLTCWGTLAETTLPLRFGCIDSSILLRVHGLMMHAITLAFLDQKSAMFLSGGLDGVRWRVFSQGCPWYRLFQLDYGGWFYFGGSLFFQSTVGSL